MMMQNILTCDMEDWYHTTLVNAKFEEWDLYPQRILDSTLRVLEILDKTKTKITFFALGWVAEKNPELIKTISDAGHEIASHGYRHRLITHLSPDEFNKDLKKSISVLSSACGKKIKGFRAPSWSIDSEKKWVFEFLSQNQILYDSSLFPFKTFLYGNNSHPRFMYEINVNSKIKLLELPPSVGEIYSKRIPFSGGFYLRVLPYWLIKKFINSYNRHCQPAIIYFHPWELDIDLPHVDLNFRDRFIQYYNIATMEKKLKLLLRDYQFVPISQFLRENIFEGKRSEK